MLLIPSVIQFTSRPGLEIRSYDTGCDELVGWLLSWSFPGLGAGPFSVSVTKFVDSDGFSWVEVNMLANVVGMLWFHRCRRVSLSRLTCEGGYRLELSSAL